MKTIFIPAKRKLNFKLNKKKILEVSLKLPKNTAIAYSVQYKEFAFEIKKILSKTLNITEFIQVLGCSKPAFSKNTKAFLLISDGKFHGASLAYETNISVYVLNINNYNPEKITPKDIEVIKRKKKASYVKFLNADNIGILISTKQGQQNFKGALSLKKKLENKNVYLFLCNNINTAEFENFKIDSWVNTACPRLDMNDSSVINISDIK